MVQLNHTKANINSLIHPMEQNYVYGWPEIIFQK